MKNNQKGFSVIEGLLILVIVGLIGFVGWYVWDSRKESKEQSNSNQVTETKDTAKTTVTVPEGWKEYTNNDIKIAFAYPKNWNVEDMEHEAILGGLDDSTSIADVLKNDVSVQPTSSGPAIYIRVFEGNLNKAKEKLIAEENDKYSNSSEEAISKQGNTGIKLTSKKSQDYTAYIYQVGGKIVLVEAQSLIDDENPVDVSKINKQIVNSLVFK